MPFNSAPAHSTRPHNAKKALYFMVSGKIPENLFHKSCCYMLFFDVIVNFLFSHSLPLPGAYLGKNVTPLTPKKLPKMAAYEPQMAKKCAVENSITKIKNNSSLFSSIFHVEPPVSGYGRLNLKFLCERYSHFGAWFIIRMYL